MYQIHLDNFEGPIDLLLYFIRRDELDIYDIPISKITKEFVDTIEEWEKMHLNVAGDFIVMASTLMRIKAKLLLPRPEFDDDGEIHHIDFDNSRIEGMFVSEKTSYGNNAEFIIWTSIYANSNFVLSRKTLELKLQQWDHNQSKTVYFYYQCRVTNWEGIEEFFKPQMDKHKENLKKNKI